MASVTTTQLCHGDIKAAKENTYTNAYGYIPVNFSHIRK
jgi:hypothetical protein